MTLLGLQYRDIVHQPLGIEQLHGHVLGQLLRVVRATTASKDDELLCGGNAQLANPSQQLHLELVSHPTGDFFADDLRLKERLGFSSSANPAE